MPQFAHLPTNIKPEEYNIRRIAQRG